MLLLSDAMGPVHERFPAAHAIFFRRGRKAEPADHCSSDHEIYFTPRRSRTLLLQHFEIVTVIWFGFVGIALFESFGHPFANRAAPSSIRIFPGQTIVFSGCADDLLRILIYFGIIMLLLRIFLLRIIEPATDRDRIELIRAYTAV